MDSVGKPRTSLAVPVMVFLMLLLLAALFVGFAPMEDCPVLRRIDIEGASPVPWDPQDPVVAQWKIRRGQHFVSKSCPLCGGTGKISLFKKWTTPPEKTTP
jgi:hypothetical protein